MMKAITHNPLDLFIGDLHLALIESVSFSQPTWMARGYVWPSLLLNEAGSKTPYFNPVTSLTKDLNDALGDVQFIAKPTIRENFTIGGVVEPDRLEDFKQDLAKCSGQILAKAKLEGWEDGCRTDLQKISECLSYCIYNKLYFVESSDIYGGGMGNIS